MAKNVLFVQEVASDDTGNSLESDSSPEIRLHKVDFPVPVFPIINNVLKGDCFKLGTFSISTRCRNQKSCNRNGYFDIQGKLTIALEF